MMAAFLSGLDAAWTFLISTLGQIFGLYTTIPVFIAIFVLWILDRVFHIFDLLRG